jgi:hypothetical protein
MTDTTASGTSPLPEGNGWLGDTAEVGPSEANSSSALEGNEWEAVTFPGQLMLSEDLEDEADLQSVPQSDLLPEVAPTLAIAESPSDSPEPLAAPPTPEELVQLIQDLNQCNDALLLRVTELEEDLERSQVALQSEVERNQAHPVGLPVATSGPVQQQIAQLLSELDIANDGLRRTTIHNEALQTELEANQQRVAQLERECTLLQQRFSEKNTALHQAEATCRDLKARLHRQQRYTLQFKAALEKCLTMTPSSLPVSTAGPATAITLPEEAAAVSIPRSQHIQPWSAGAAATATEQPSLTQLLRGLRPSTSSPRPATPAAAAPAAPAEPDPVAVPSERLEQLEAFDLLFPGALPEAEIDPAPAPTSQSPDPTPDPWMVVEASPAGDPPTPAVDPPSLFTEPSPWGEPVAANLSPAPPAVVPLPDSLLAVSSPVGNPGVEDQREPVVASPATPLASVAASPATALPAYLASQDRPSPSPLVYPLRSQKKIKSLAAVELPSFGRSVRRH